MIYEQIDPAAQVSLLKLSQPTVQQEVIAEVAPFEQLDQAVDEQPQVSSPNEEAHQPGWLRRNAFKISAGLFLGGTALTLSTNPLSHLEHQDLHRVEEAAPWAIGAGLATETMWVGGVGMMLAGAGKKIGNPLSLKSRWGEASESIIDSPVFKTGLKVNTVGAIGTAAVLIGGAAAALPIETLPGVVGVALADMASTVAVRAPLYGAIKNRRNSGEDSVAGAEKARKPKVNVRNATFDDIDRLADIDLILFDKAYGTAKPEKQEIVDMLEQRLANNPGWMFVAEVNNQVEGFVTAFRTNTPVEGFESWEHSTANGTLEDKVDPSGKYGYVANMTIMHDAVELGAEDMLLANLFANGIESGLEYAYFIGRMPHFKRWLEANDALTTDAVELQKLAEQYIDLKNEDGKRYDPQVRMYEGFGFHMKRMVAKAFEDDASMDYGIVFQADIPPTEALKKFAPVRILTANVLRQVAKHPKLLAKVL
jgi:hypothetical protein